MASTRVSARTRPVRWPIPPVSTFTVNYRADPGMTPVAICFISVFEWPNPVSYCRDVFKQRIFELNKARENGRGPTVNEAAIKVCRSYRLRGFKANSLININQLS